MNYFSVHQTNGRGNFFKLPFYLFLFLSLSCNYSVVKGQSNSSFEKPTEAFISELKLLNESEKPHSLIYDFTATDFKNFEPLSLENLVEDYYSLLHLSEDYELRHSMNTTVPKHKNTKELYEVSKYKPYYKGFLIDWQSIIIYHEKGKIAKIFSHVPRDLDIDTDYRISEEKATLIFRTYIDEKGYNYFKKIERFEPTLLINQERLTYRFSLNVFTPSDHFLIYMNAKTGEIFYEKSTVQH